MRLVSKDAPLDLALCLAGLIPLSLKPCLSAFCSAKKSAALSDPI